MSVLRRLLVISCLCMLAGAVWAAEPPGLLAEWTFDEGDGPVAHDSSGNGRDARVFGATWVKQGNGFALSLGGPDSYVDCGQNQALGVTGPVTVAAWIKPIGKPRSDAPLLGMGMSSYGMTQYDDVLYWYVGHGKASSSWLGVKLTAGEWSHVAATYDNQQMRVWVNGREAASRKTKVETYPLDGPFQMSSQARPGIAKFRGVLDNVRVYNRALTRNDVLARLRTEGAAYGIEVYAIDDAVLHAGTRFFKSHPNQIDLVEQGDSILFANRQIGLAFQKSDRGFQLYRLYGIADDQDFLTGGVIIGYRDLFKVVMTLDPKRIGRDDRGKTKGALMGIIHEMAGDSFPVGSKHCKSVSWRKEDTAAGTVLHLEWKGIDVRENKGVMDVEATVRLRAGDPLSYWRINIMNRGSIYGIERVRFPNLNLAPIGNVNDNRFVYPKHRGGLVNPFKYVTGFGSHIHTDGAYYPHTFNMQFQALYNKGNGKGIYLGTRDPTPNFMNIQIINTRSELAWRPGHFPPNITFASEDYSLPYDCVAGPFRGDWYDACQIYREWAIRQTWCRKGPLFTRKEVPEWYKEAPLFLYTNLADSATGTHSVTKNLPIAADNVREWLDFTGMRLPCDLRDWKEAHYDLSTYSVPFNIHRPYTQGRWAGEGFAVTNSHDGNYPKIPAISTFSAVCKKLRADGGMMIPYLALEIFDQGPSENSPYAAEAKPNVSRDLFGAMRTWGRETSWQPCGWTQWWRDRLTETCILMLDRENVGGFYLDVMQGTSLPCYWTPHGHSAAGGSSMAEAMHGLCEQIYDAIKAADPEAITTGENPAENMIDVIDGMLQNTLSGETQAPILAAVYQDYISRYGLEMSVHHRGDDFFMECASLFTGGAQIGRIRVRPRSATLSFQNPEHKEMIAFLSRLVGYYKNETTRKFLAYGQLMRPLEFAKPSPMPMLPYTDPYSEGKSYFPSLMSGVFRTDDGRMGVFVVNPSTQDLKFQATVDLTRYKMSANTIVVVDSIDSDGMSKNVISNVKGKVTLEKTLPGHGITAYLVQPAGE